MRQILFLLLIITTVLSAQGILKTEYDPVSRQAYENIKTDSTDVKFFRVAIDRELLYKKPQRNSDPVFSLVKDSFVENKGETGDGKYLRVQVYDGSDSFVEGFVRKSSLFQTPYYGKPLNSMFEKVKSKSAEHIDKYELNPHWVNAEQLFVYEEGQDYDGVFTGSGNKVASLKMGDVVYLTSVDGVKARVNVKDKSAYSSGYTDLTKLSPYLTISDAKANLKELYGTYSPALLKYGLDNEGFISYSVLEASGTFNTKYTEDRRCFVVGEDSLLYKSSVDTGIKDIVTDRVIKNNPIITPIVAYKFLEDEDIKTFNDILTCRVVELVYQPKSAKIVIDGVEEGSSFNKKQKLYIYYIEKLGMDVIYQSEELVYDWKYKFDTVSGKYIEKDYSEKVILKRVSAFRGN